MLFPISDDDSKLSGPAYFTWAILIINVLVYFYQVSDPQMTYRWAMTPKEIASGVDLVSPVMMTVEGQDVEVPHLPGPPIIYITLLTSMFMHGSIGHLFGNMLYLWIFGDNVEHRFGHIPFLIFYLVSGLFASFAQIVIAPESVIPNLGASGAIFGILGAYMVLFPRNKVNAILLYFIVSLPALYVIGLWTVLQVFSVFGSFFGPPQAGGVAYMAHVGGLIAGVAAGLALRFSIQSEPDSVLYRQYQKDPTAKRLW
ncbi:rhomboid family intramembrane serine protease [Mariniblastus sp.]|nr:rhomboid family intramembrane serine protease [Mariniblastus sp.]